MILTDTNSIYVYGLSLIARQTGSAVEYYHTDALGSVRSLTNGSGQNIGAYTYRAFGEPLLSSTSSTNRFEYTGQRDDSYIKLYQMGSREYDQELGRFISPDTIVPDLSNPQSFNRYLYGYNNPLKFTDPTGHYSIIGVDDDGNDIIGEDPNDPHAMAYNPNVPDLVAYQPGSNPTTPVDLFWEWSLGKGPERQVFHDGDPMTELLQEHSHIGEARATMADFAAAGDDKQHSLNYGLGGLGGVPKYVNDYSTLATGGRTGNLAVTYLGSYYLDARVLSVDQTEGTAMVDFHVWNESDLNSGTHWPVVGYTPFWEEHMKPTINSVPAHLPAIFGRQPLSRTRQDFYWKETIRFR